ncbi:uncharacterized protein LOC115880819 [Sitophilus oryzae]|uniref:Uncharacterized protein LOC115880819 n=1 Tax=Sitophilus oryzae TaxID=7048 RepID=A0A6J2XR31_SITOR|nr:uncharacterized protein LOC115880819 [Sitophilus oryzae]
MLYGSKVWQLSEKHKKKLMSIEMDFWRRSARISRLDRIRNERIREKMKVEGNIVRDIQEKQLQWYGHVQRMADDRIPKQVLQWTPTDRRKRGRPKLSWNQGIDSAMSERNLLPGDWDNRRRWRMETGGRRRTL